MITKSAKKNHCPKCGIEFIVPGNAELKAYQATMQQEENEATAAEKQRLAHEEQLKLGRPKERQKKIAKDRRLPN